MSSIGKTTMRNQKATCLGLMQGSRPDRYGAFDVDSKLEGICGLILLGLMHVQEVLEDVVHTRAGADTHGWIFQYVRRPIIPCRGFPVGKTALAMIPSRHELSLLVFHKVFATLPGN